MQTVINVLELVMTDSKTFAAELGTRLVQLRKDQELTQTELGEMVDLSQQVIADYEAGRKNIPVWRLMNLAEALGVDIHALVSEPARKQRKRGPAPKLQKQMEKISDLPTKQQKSIIEVLDMALKTM